MATDTYDAIEWLVKNVPNNNGKVGMWGISYPGFYVAAGMIDAHPALADWARRVKDEADTEHTGRPLAALRPKSVKSSNCWRAISPSP